MGDIWKDYKGWIITGVITALVLMTWNGHSSRVGMRNDVLKENAEIQNQFQRRADLVPNLVKTVEGNANFERGILKDVVEGRAKATQVTVSAADLTDPVKLKAFQDAQQQLSGSLARLLVAVERYPDLKASAGYQTLQAQLEGTENRIATARARQIKAARDYNTSLETLTGGFYTALFASFRPVAYFEADPGANKVPQVNFGKS